jgi:hypothetical protein
MAAEELVINSGLSYNIYRLGVIVGDRKGCAINSFNGFYGYAMVPYFLAESMRLRREDSGSVELPITIRCSLKSTINLVPVDWVVSQLVSLIALGTFGEIYHITHPDPPLSSWVLGVIFDYLNVRGISYADPAGGLQGRGNGEARHLQRLFDKQTDIFAPYLTEEKPFDASSVVKRLGSDYEAPDAITRTWVQGLLGYAISRNFGRRTTQTGRRR